MNPSTTSKKISAGSAQLFQFSSSSVFNPSHRDLQGEKKLQRHEPLHAFCEHDQLRLVGGLRSPTGGASDVRHKRNRYGLLPGMDIILFVFPREKKPLLTVFYIILFYDIYLEVFYIFFKLVGKRP